MAITSKGKNSGAVKLMVQEHYREIADSGAKLGTAPKIPAEGWVRTIRKALDMSGAQLAERLNVSRNWVSVLERKEAEGDISINQLKELADALGCDFTYALIPKKPIKMLMQEQAEKIAKERLESNSQNMFLEAQSISPAKKELLFKQTTESLLQAGGRALWKKETRKKQK